MKDKDIINKVFNEMSEDILAEKIIVGILEGYGIDEDKFHIASDIIQAFIHKGIKF